mmetsp:Transcript_36369/g.90849  ORF Transcript_36369/g.90849 Transcript_36369/m.90849 type:complete len:368 (-) Transcript_36369:901-2004(-)
MTEKGFRIVTDKNLGQAEASEFPVVCESCLGDNPYVRMMKGEADKECEVCQRPFTSFRWKPGAKARYKKTIVCQTCAKLKNVCQVCLFDLEYGLPVQVRDKFLEDQQKVELPDSGVNRDYFASQMDRMTEQDALPYGKAPPHPALQRLARLEPYYKRNRARVCSFWLKGECNRGDECPYRHSQEEGDPELQHQNIKDRYLGENDPVARKILRNAAEFNTLTPPDDGRITTLFVAGLDASVTESDIRDVFYPFGEIRSIKMVPRQVGRRPRDRRLMEHSLFQLMQQAAFVTYTTRKAAEDAAEKLFKSLTIGGRRAKLMWGRQSSSDATAPAAPPAGYPSIPQPGIGQRLYYPSADPATYGGNAPIQR